MMNPIAEFPTARVMKWSSVFLLFYFGLRLLYLSVTISPSVPPDEVTHFGICSVFSRVLFLPENSPESYQHGLVTNIPWLYYWIMGKFLHLNFFGIPDLIFLRILNIPLAFVTVYFVWRTLRLLTDDRLTQILLIVAMTNTMMFTFLSAFVSYDNLTNLLAAMSIYYLMAFFKYRNCDSLLASLLCQVTACLTKAAMLPLVLVLGILLIIHEYKKLPLLAQSVAGYFRTSPLKAYVLTSALIGAFSLNVQLYGVNYITYKTLQPEMHDVISVDAAMQNRLAARDLILRYFKDGRVSREQALQMASAINHQGERINTVALIDNYTEFRNSGFLTMNVLAYMPLWVERMAAGIFGVFGHIAIPNYWPTIAPLAFLALMTFVAGIQTWRFRNEGGEAACLVIMTVCYAAFLMYRVNYQSYLYYGTPFVGLQGRYIFPVLGPIYVVSSYFFMKFYRWKYVRLPAFAFAVITFVMSDFPLFLARITPQWFMP